ncbi:hypothetical protein [Synechococcus sp. UW140]
MTDSAISTTSDDDDEELGEDLGDVGRFSRFKQWGMLLWLLAGDDPHC